MLRSRSDAGKRLSSLRGAAEFAAATIVLALALFLAVGSASALQRGDRALAILLSVLALSLAGIIAFTTVPRIARRIDFRRWRLPYSFGITREGGVFILAVVLLSLVAINTGNNLLFLIVSTLLSTIIISGIAARLSLRSVLVSLQVPENVFRGEPVAFKISLRNRKRFMPAFSILVEDAAARSHWALGSRLRNLFRRRAGSERSVSANLVLEQAGYFPIVLPGSVQSELVSQTFPVRGLFRLNGFRISTRFPFGFFRRGERIEARGEVYVYPKIQAVSSYFHLLPFRPGNLEGSQRGQGESLYSIRRYQEGESARVVDWKATAKTGEVMAREYAREEENRFCLILDTRLRSRPGDERNEQFEKAVSVAASLAAHFLEEGAELELLTSQHHVDRGVGRDHLYRILKTLAVVRADTVQEDSPDPDGSDPCLRDEIFSEKIFKIILTSRPRGSFPAAVWRSSHVIYFDEI